MPLQRGKFRSFRWGEAYSLVPPAPLDLRAAPAAPPIPMKPASRLRTRPAGHLPNPQKMPALNDASGLICRSHGATLMARREKSAFNFRRSLFGFHDWVSNRTCLAFGFVFPLSGGPEAGGMVRLCCPSPASWYKILDCPAG